MPRLFRHATHLIPLLLAVGLLFLTLRSADLGRALALILSLGWWLLLLPLPSLAATLAESAGWWLTFLRLGPRPRFGALLGVRLVCDAALNALPSGAVVSESLQPYLLRRRCGVPFEIGVVAGVGRKFLVICSHGLFLALATILAWPALHRATANPALDRLPWLLLATAGGLVAVALGTAAAGVHGRLADRLRRALDRLGGRFLGSWLERNALRFRRADEQLAAFFRRRPAGLALPLGLTALAWLLRAIETLVFLRLLGVRLPLPAAMVIESSLILLRSIAVPIPAGLGVQDLGYVTSLRALGVPDAATVGAAFVLLKRGRELLGVLVGATIFAMGRERGVPTLVSSGSP
jgi:uncharacterized protein (TIRG00374 family)